MSKIIRIAQPLISKEEKDAVIKVLNSGKFIQGENVQKFEKEFTKYIGCKYAIAVSSGTAALHLALLSLGIISGHEVVTPSFSFISTANCALYCGAKPVFADIHPRTFNIDPNSVKEKLSRNTKVIIPVHLYGQPSDIDELLKIASEKDIYVVEDCAQAVGAEFNGKKVGAFGDIGCFSFYPTKGITTLEGGMIVTNDEKLSNKLRLLRNIGQESTYKHTELGYNYRMNEVEATIGILQLKNLNKWTKQRIKNAKFLTKNLQEIEGIIPPFNHPKVLHTFNTYTIRVTKEFRISRDDVVKQLINQGIEAKVYYSTPIHKQPVYEKLGYGGEYLPETENASKEVLSLPVHPNLSESDLNKIVASIKHLSSF